MIFGHIDMDTINLYNAIRRIPMAERRMFSKKIVDSDAFLEMPQSSQNLYFHLAMRADDDGFVNSPVRIMRMIGAAEDDMRVLLTKRFLIGFDSGVVVIKHWRIHNYIQRDRYKPTVYTDELSRLGIKENGSYTENVYKLDTTCTPRLGKDSIGKDSIDKIKINAITLGDLQNVTLSRVEYDKLKSLYLDVYINDYVSRLSLWKPNASRKVKSDLATLMAWMRRDNVPKIVPKQLCPHCGKPMTDGDCLNPECPQWTIDKPVD